MLVDKRSWLFSFVCFFFTHDVSMNGIASLSMKDPKPRWKFLVISFMASAEKNMSKSAKQVHIKVSNAIPTDFYSELGHLFLIFFHRVRQIHQVVEIDRVVLRLPEPDVNCCWSVYNKQKKNNYFVLRR